MTGAGSVIITRKSHRLFQNALSHIYDVPDSKRSAAKREDLIDAKKQYKRERRFKRMSETDLEKK